MAKKPGQAEPFAETCAPQPRSDFAHAQVQNTESPLYLLKTRSLGMLFCAISVCGCSTTPQLPAMSSFANSVAATSVGVEKRYKAEKIEDLYQEEYNQEVAAQQLVLARDGCAELLSPEGISLTDPRLDDYSKHCKLVPSRLKADGSGFEPVVFNVPTHQPGADGWNARRVSLALTKYSISLKALAESKLPGELGVKFKAAAMAAKTLGVEVSQLSEGSGLDPKSLAIAETGIDLIGSLVSESFEARRYAMVKRIVEQSEQRVEVAALILATWYHEQQLPILKSMYDQLQDKVRAQSVAAGKAQRGEGTEEELLVATRELRTLQREIEKVETEAKWRVFLEVAQAHYAIKASFDNPDLDVIAAANDRIIALVTKTDAFVKSIEEAGQE